MLRMAFDEHRNAILAYARRTSTATDADDVVAETFLVAWRRVDEMPSGIRLRPWLYGVAGHVLANQRRGSVRRRRLIERMRGERQGVPDEDDHVAVESAVGQALVRLPAAEREVLGLTYWEDLDPGEIAVALGCSRNAARIRLHRARRSLERELEELRKGTDPRVPCGPIRKEGLG